MSSTYSAWSESNALNAGFTAVAPRPADSRSGCAHHRNAEKGLHGVHQRGLRDGVNEDPDGGQAVGAHTLDPAVVRA